MGLAGAVVAVTVLAAGCSSGDEPNDNPVTRQPVDILDTSVDLVDGVVTSACFTFEMPTTIEYEINPDSLNCQTAIRFAGGDILSEITVTASTGENGIDNFFQKLEENTAGTDVEITSTSVLTLADGEVGVAYFDDSYGLARVIYFIPETRGAFVSDGEPVTSFMISGMVGAPDMADAINEVFTSFTVLNG